MLGIHLFSRALSTHQDKETERNIVKERKEGRKNGAIDGLRLHNPIEVYRYQDDSEDDWTDKSPLPIGYAIVFVRLLWV